MKWEEQIMKSKTFCFNRTIFRKNVTHFWPIWVLYLCYLLVTLPISIWVSVKTSQGMEISSYEILYGVLDYGVGASAYLIVSVIVAVAVFSYLNFAKNTNMIHALPVDRKELFLTNYCSGLCFLWVPELITFVVAVFVCLACQITCAQYLLYWLFFAAGISLFGYTLAVLLTMFSGQILAMPIYFIIANFLYVGIRYIIAMIINLISYGLMEGWKPGYSGMLSPWYFLERHLGVEYQYSHNGTKIAGLSVYGQKYVLIYAAVSVIFFFLAWFLYKKRDLETAGDLISVKWLKPVFRWGIAMCGGILLAIAVTTVIQEVTAISAFVCVLICMAIFGFLCFVIAEMLLQKSFKVLKKKVFVEAAAFLCVSIGILSLFRMDIFGLEGKIPEENEIQEAFLYMDYPIYYKGDDAGIVTQIHQEILSHKKEYQNVGNNGNMLTIKYMLKDGSTLVRRYMIPTGEEELAKKDSVASLVGQEEKKFDNQMKNMFGLYYEEDKLLSGTIDLYDSEGKSTDYDMDEKQLEKIYQAYMQDVKEGNLDYQLYILNPDYADNQPGDFYNNIKITYYNEKGSLTSNDYYFNYYYHDIDVKQKTGTAYIPFNENCTNLVKALEETGIVNNGWHLYTYDEYNALTGVDTYEE